MSLNCIDIYYPKLQTEKGRWSLFKVQTISARAYRQFFMFSMIQYSQKFGGRNSNSILKGNTTSIKLTGINYRLMLSEACNSVDVGIGRWLIHSSTNRYY
jgi:hypothetical protein